ncbi:MAG: hypothetical protein MUC78_11305 [Bacteroidales bacterium]|jgi:hypothetical protein|nr:hypothetical protein [Bacteroidales bacterium]
MLRFTAVVLLFVETAAGINAGEPLYVPHGAGELGMAFSSSAFPGHWSCFHNQALLVQRSATSVACALETRYMLPSLSSQALSLMVAGSTAPLGIILTHYGNGDYYRVFSGVGSAVKITDRFALGIQIDYLTERSIGDYRDLSHITFEAGTIMDITSDLTVGLHILNPLASLNSMPSSVSAAVAWHQSDNLYVTAQLSKVTDEPLSFHGGINWKIMDKLVLMSGYMSSPSAFALGTGLRAGQLQIDAGFLIYSVTGITSSVSFIWIIGGKEG